MNLRITLLLSIFAAISSCTIERRLYTKGFHVEFRKRTRESDSKDHPQAMTELREEPTEEIHPDSVEITSMSEEPGIHQTPAQPTDENLALEKPVVPEQFAGKRFAFDKKKSTHIVPLKKPKFRTNRVATLKEKQLKKPKNDRNYSKFWEIMGFIGLIAGLLGIILLFIFIENPVCLLILQIILAGLVLAGLIWLIVALCGIRIEWFWSGR